MPLKETGKTYKVAGQDVILYPIAKLVTELERIGYPRDSQTIRKWEASGITPPSLFRVGNKRLYSKEQIDLYCRIAQECDIRQGFRIAHTDFSARIWEEMTELNKKYQ